MNREAIVAAFRRRVPWLIACGLFPIMVVATHIAVLPGNTLTGPQVWKINGITVVTVCVGVRLVWGLALAEETWKAWFYFFLPIPFAITINWLEGVVLNPPDWAGKLR